MQQGGKNSPGFTFKMMGMGSEMTLTAEEPALQVMIDGSAKMSVIISSQEIKLKVKKYWEKNKPQNEITLICRCLNM